MRNKNDNKDPALYLPNIVVGGQASVSSSAPIYCVHKKKHHHTAVTAPAQLAPSVESFELTQTAARSSEESSSSSSEESGVESEEVYSSTDSEVDAAGWLTCRTQHVLPNYGMPLTLVGKTFTVAPNFKAKASFAEKCSQEK